MIEDFSKYNIYIKPGFTDMRKQINGLLTLAENEITDNVVSDNLFLFCNKSRTHLKILYWNRNGFCLWLKRLEKNKFPWPHDYDSNEISYEELKMLLRGIDFFGAHKKLQNFRAS